MDFRVVDMAGQDLSAQATGNSQGNLSTPNRVLGTIQAYKNRQIHYATYKVTLGTEI
jgi:hypothetical protein